MDCHTCGHSMQSTGCHQSGQPFQWCPNCGTIRTCDGIVAAPFLALQQPVNETGAEILAREG